MVCMCSDVTAAMLVYRKKRDFSPVRVNFYFYANYVNKFSVCMYDRDDQ